MESFTGMQSIYFFITAFYLIIFSKSTQGCKKNRLRQELSQSAQTLCPKHIAIISRTFTAAFWSENVRCPTVISSTESCQGICNFHVFHFLLVKYFDILCFPAV